MDEAVRRENFPSTSIIFAAASCSQNSWCYSICRLLDSRLVLTSLLISGGISIAPDGDKVTCYTPRKRVIYPHPSAVISSPQEHDIRILSNIEDGTFTWNVEDCFLTRWVELRFALVQFPSVKVVTAVKIVILLEGNYSPLFHDIEVRVGNSHPVGNDFSANELLGVYEGPPANGEWDIVLRPSKPLVGTLVSVRALTSDPLQIYMLEVLGE